jgi:hypothetical protein
LNDGFKIKLVASSTPIGSPKREFGLHISTCGQPFTPSFSEKKVGRNAWRILYYEHVAVFFG